ncbi:hypothetical protein [Mycoplasmopsis meleagridis]|uniref:hypothetical protein n=1 Tax=Mycoplasmopsis meleagridis TaxID=29561 RepID=UPI00073D60BC|nr:hypothetical protein [Mycoplasmopsis meleagridis]KUH47514.1 hypothetical protein ASB56_00035 [Mycoplasmopsis meleagridis]
MNNIFDDLGTFGESVKDTISPLVKKYFSFHFINFKQLEIKPNSINVIEIKKEATDIFEGFIDSEAAQIVEANGELFNDKKTTILFDALLSEKTGQKLDFKNYFILLKEIKDYEKNEKVNYFVVDSFTISKSAENPNNETINLVVYSLENWELNRNAKIKILEVENFKNTNKFIHLPPTILLSKLFTYNFNDTLGFYSNISDITENNNYFTYNGYDYLNMIVNPVLNNNNNFYYYFYTLKILGLLEFDPNLISRVDNNINLEYQNITTKFLNEVLEIKKNQDIIYNNFTTVPIDKVEEWKQKLGTDPVKYADYELNNLLSNYLSYKENFKILLLMCSEWLKSTFCFNGGYTDIHKHLLPFYIDRIGPNNLRFLSNFYSFDAFNYNQSGKSWFKLVPFNPIKEKRFSLSGSVFPLLPDEISEVNISANLNEMQNDNLKYLVKFFIPQNKNINFTEFIKPPINTNGAYLDNSKSIVKNFFLLFPVTTEIAKKINKNNLVEKLKSYYDFYPKKNESAQYAKAKFVYLAQPNENNVSYLNSTINARYFTAKTDKIAPQSKTIQTLDILNYRGLTDPKTANVIPSIRWDRAPINYVVSLKENKSYEKSENLTSYKIFNTNDIPETEESQAFTIATNNFGWYILLELNEENPDALNYLTKKIYSHNFTLNTNEFSEYYRELLSLPALAINSIPNALKIKIPKGTKLEIRALNLPNLINITDDGEVSDFSQFYLLDTNNKLSYLTFTYLKETES